MNSALGHPLPKQVLVRVRRRGEQKLGDLVGQNAVNLFRHRAVERPQARFHMGHWYQQFSTNHGRRHSRVHITINHHEVCGSSDEDRLERGHNGSRLRRVAARAHFQIDLGPGDAQLVEENGRHVGVEMLPGVYQYLPGDSGFGERRRDRRHLHEIRPRSDDVHNLHSLKPASAFPSSDGS